MLDEIFAGERRELTLRRMVDGLPADELLGERYPVLVDVVPKVGSSGVRADHQHVGDSGQRVAHLSEEFMFGPDLAAMLAGEVLMGLDVLGLRVFGVEPQHLGFVMVDMNHGTGDWNSLNSLFVFEDR